MKGELSRSPLLNMSPKTGIQQPSLVSPQSRTLSGIGAFQVAPQPLFHSNSDDVHLHTDPSEYNDSQVDQRPITANTILSQMETPKIYAEKFIHHMTLTELQLSYPKELLGRQRSHSTLGLSTNAGGNNQSAMRGSLNYVVKKKEAARIDRENEKIMKSLIKQSPQFNQKQIEDHQRQHDKLRKLLQKSKVLPLDHVIKTKNLVNAKVQGLPPVNQFGSKRGSYMLDNILAMGVPTYG